MPRSIWNGTIASESKTVQFREVHAKDGARVEHRRICPKEDKEVSYDEVVKGFEVEADKYVVLDKDEIKAAAGEAADACPARPSQRLVQQAVGIGVVAGAHVAERR